MQRLLASWLLVLVPVYCGVFFGGWRVVFRFVFFGGGLLCFVLLALA
jgi:hypothetical protein